MRSYIHILDGAREPRNRARRALRAIILLAAAVVAACGGGDSTGPSDPPPVRVASVEVQPAEHLLEVGQSVRLTATPRSATGDRLDRAVEWRSEGSAIAAVTSAGVVTAKGEGTARVLATSEGRSGAARIVVRAAGAEAPAPVLAALLPSGVVAGSAGITLRVTGAGFVAASRIHWNGAERATTYVSAGELQATIAAAELASVATVAIAVRTPAPGGGTSAPLDFVVRAADAPAPAPTIAALSPARITAGWGGQFTLTITGDGFTPQSRILWNGAERETHHISATELRTTVYPSDVATPDSVEVAVETPAPGGGRAVAVFAVNAVPVARVELGSAAGAAWVWGKDRYPMDVVAKDQLGRVLTGRVARWTSADEGIATVMPTGAMSGAAFGVAPGQVAVTATVDGVSASRTLRVLDEPGYDLVYDFGTGAGRRLAIWSPGTASAPRRIPLPITAYDPSPSPDGRMIAFTGIGDDGNADIYVVGRDGSGLRRLTSDPGVDERAAWSPDGGAIAFASTRAGHSDVWVMDADGANPRRLTSASVMTPVPGSGMSAGGAAWSPDGARLVYVVGTNAETDLWIMDADGGAKRQLTSGPEVDIHPAWSPDGRTIAFRRTGAPTQQGTLMAVMAADGTPVWSVINMGNDHTPAFSPDGRWLTMSDSDHGPASLRALPLQALGAARVVVDAALGGAANAEWMRR